MTRKELQETVEWYRPIAKSCRDLKYRDAKIADVCYDIATEACYNHHERGQRLWAFFQALEKETITFEKLITNPAEEMEKAWQQE